MTSELRQAIRDHERATENVLILVSALRQIAAARLCFFEEGGALGNTPDCDCASCIASRALKFAHLWNPMLDESRAELRQRIAAATPERDTTAADSRDTEDEWEWSTKPATLDEMNEWEYEANENPRPNPITLAVRLVRVITAYRALAASVPEGTNG